MRTIENHLQEMLIVSDEIFRYIKKHHLLA